MTTHAKPHGEPGSNTDASVPVGGAVGRPVDRRDGHAKVTGTALFSAEHRYPNLTYATMVHATIARGTITGIDTAAAAAVPGVLAVLTHLNAPRIRPVRKANIIRDLGPSISGTAVDYLNSDQVIADQLTDWVASGRDFAVATVVAVTGSAPRPVGAALAVDSDGVVIGSVSGGCVEGAVYELCRQVLQHGVPVLERFGYSDSDAFAVGLTCGGIIDILITPVRAGTADGEVIAAALAAFSAGETVALARIVDGPGDLTARPLLVRPDGSHGGTLGGHRALDATAAAMARAMHDTGTAVIGEDGSHCGRPVTLLIESSVPPPRMIIFGAIDFAGASPATAGGEAGSGSLGAGSGVGVLAMRHGGERADGQVC